MKNFIELTEKEERFVIGLMSGTSVDAVDAALVKITGSGTDTRLELLGFIEYPFAPEIREIILKNTVNETAQLENICRLNFVIPQIYSEAIKELLYQLDFPREKIDLIGSHGQTIQHLPGKENFYGYNGASTLQIGDPAVLAKLTGVVCVGDFRVGDMALGGQGAPLIPYFDYLIFRSDKKNRLLLNIGGISNFTVLPRKCTIEEIRAFDTGPGNMLLDLLVKKYFNLQYDINGEKARSGKFNEDLFNALVVKDNFIERTPPKSTGREYYGMNFLESCFQEFNNLSPEDWLNTLTYYTVYGIYRNYEKFVKPTTEVNELVVSGGGAKNKFLLELLKEKFDGVEVKIIDEIGLSGDAKEAVCFAVLANETINGNPSNVPGATGASRSAILGKICLP